MIIRVIANKYRCGSNYGMNYYDDDKMLEKLNQVIEWDKSGFPFEVKEGGSPFNRKYLGDNPVLKPGDCFYWDSQEFAIDSPTRLILLNSETGFMAAERFITEVVDNEMKLNQDRDTKSVIVEEIKSEDVINKRDGTFEINGDILTKTYTPNFSLMKLWKNKYWKNRHLSSALKIKVESEKYLVSPVIYVKNWTVLYDPTWIFDEEMIECVTMDAFGYLFQNFDYVAAKPPIEEEKEMEKKKE